MAKRFHAICGQAAQQAGENAKRDGMNPGQLQPRLRRAGLKYYADCEFTMYTKKQRQLESSDAGLGELASPSAILTYILANYLSSSFMIRLL